MSPLDLERLAELVVGHGVNLQPGQVLSITTEPGKEAMTRAIATAAYRAGARYVDPWYFDPHVKRARLLFGREEDLGFVPSWYGQRLLELGRQRCARVSLSGVVTPGLLDDVDPARRGRDQLPHLAEGGRVVNERTTNWCAVPCPTPGWARLVHPDLEPEAAYARLVDELEHVLRLDEPDPVAAWTARFDELVGAAEALDRLRPGALRFRGPGTDLTVGLLPSSRWLAARFETVDGIVHHPNLPSEEVFSTPDPERVDGHVTATKPLHLAGTVIDGLRVEFAGGRAVRIDAQRNAETLRAYAERDPGAGRLGEVALVDGRGRIGPLGTVFYDTLLDENAASHVALGSAYAFAVEDPADRERANDSEIHVDFMIGGPEVEVSAVAPDGTESPVLREGSWAIPRG